MPSRIVLGLIGPMASGKSTVCSYLTQKHNAGYVRFSSVLRDILGRIYLPQTRQNMQKLSSILRSNFGDDLLALTAAKDVEAVESNIAAVDGVRREPDIKHLKELQGFYLISIDADIRVRHERITKRSENPDDQSKTFKQFVKENQAEAELQIMELQKKAPFQIDNSGSFEDLYRQVEGVLKKIKG